MNNWWQSRNIQSYSEIIHSINYSLINAHGWIKKCKHMYSSLNQLWIDFYHYNKSNNLLGNDDELKIWSDNKGFQMLLLSIDDQDKVDLVNSENVQKLVLLDPKIMNHDTLRKEYYDPYNIPEKLVKKASEEHRQLENASNRNFHAESNNGLIALIKKLTQILYIVRSNIAHGGKTPLGPV